MPGPRDMSDANVILRDGSVDFLNTETLTATIAGGIHKVSGVAVNVLVPQASSGDSLKVVAKFTDSGKTIEVTHTDSIDDSTTFPYLLRLPLPMTKAEALSVVLTVTGGPGDFGAVQVWIEGVENAKTDA